MRYWLLACALLLGCKETPAPVRPPEQAPRAEPPDKRPIIAAFGNSLSAGLGVAPGSSYPEFLQKELDRRGASYRVVNAGISGDTSSDGLARLDLALALRPSIVILEFGANDGLRGLPVSTTQANLEQMIVALRKAGVKVLLAGMTLPPNYGADYIRSFEGIFTGLAKKHNVPLIPFFLQGVAGSAEFMQPDGLHPTAEGNRRVAQTVMKALEPLIS